MGKCIRCGLEHKSSETPFVGCYEAQTQRIEELLNSRDVVWKHLQMRSPWSESNDMLWSDEIIVGIEGLVIKLIDAIKRNRELDAKLKATTAVVDAAKEKLCEVDRYDSSCGQCIERCDQVKVCRAVAALDKDKS